jgi:hypothetical protein
MDIYDKEIARLTANPEAIKSSWMNCGPLFNMCRSADYIGDKNIGCLTMIRRDDGYHAQTQELTDAIRADKRIPIHYEKIVARDLPVFASWQRRMDKELGRKPPT